MKKIINIITQMEAGGAQGASIRMSEELTKKGFISETWFLYIKNNTYYNHSLAKSIFSYKPKNIKEYIKLIYLLYKKLQHEKPDAIILYTHYANIIGGFIGKLIGIKVIIATHRSKIELYPTFIREIDKLFGLIGVYTYKVFVSEVVKKSFSSFPKKYFENSKIISNGIEEKKCFLHYESIYKKFDIPKNKFICISTGRLIYYKNQIFLIELFEKMNKDIDCILLLVGDGEDREKLKNYIKKKKLNRKVKLLGEIPPDYIRCLLEISDIFLFASTTESFGFSVLEAMNAKLPVICNKIEALEYIVGDNGFLLKGNNIEEWINIIYKLKNDKRTYIKFSISAYRQSKNFTLEKMVNEHIALIEGYST